MGRPLSKQQLFGANSDNNIKVQFHNGTASVKGYIVKQTGSSRFVCEDASGNTATCYLKDKASADLQAGEMSITFKYDDGTIQQATKISRHRATFLYNGEVRSFPWNFSTSTTDGAWQIEEAGTDAAMTSSVDLEGDDVAIPTGMDRNAPLPGSGTWATAVGAGVPAYSLKGTAYAPGASVATVTSSTSGLYRQKYVGYPFTGANNTGSYNFSFFSTPTNGPISTPDHEVDTFIGFGQRDDLPFEDGYSFEWKGYLQVPVSGTYNTYISCDDDVAMWIGTGAISPSTSNIHHKQPYVNANAAAANANSLVLTTGVWYPVRIWFSEFGGSERFQLFMNNNQNATVYGYDGTSTALLWAHNSTTKGF